MCGGGRRCRVVVVAALRDEDRDRIRIDLKRRELDADGTAGVEIRSDRRRRQRERCIGRCQLEEYFLGAVCRQKRVRIVDCDGVNIPPQPRAVSSPRLYPNASLA